jgi:Asp-tRNA(Asn)/Glu-tRNA(Gln) amidotransferase A subunit family amidase
MVKDYIACDATEPAILGTTEGRLKGPARNPWNIEHSPSGSSGVSAAFFPVSRPISSGSP